ncbi:MAG: radical SAM protein [Syntrophales bacterium]|nr:radical SAM protein [Syntrophales bacterium]
MRKNILLINPWIYDFAAYDLWIKPLGLLYIAAFLRKNGYHVNLIDCLDTPHINSSRRKSSGHGKYPKENIQKPEPLKNIPRRYNRYGITPAIFHKTLSRHERPDMIIITSMMTYWYPGVFEVIRMVRNAIPGVPVILGGNYVTLCLEHASSSGADFTIAGEGEKQMPKLLEEILGEDSSFMPDFNDLDSYPYPAFDLISYKDQFPILTSKGCPYRCTYCASHLLNNKFRRRDPFKVVDEMTFWNRRLGIRNFSFYDDALLINPEEMAIPMLKEIIRRQLLCQFHCPNGLHLREITEELGILMFRAGFRTIRFGFETSDFKKQLETGGKVSNEELRKAVRHLKKAGYRTEDIGIYLLCGLPGQTASEVCESIHFVQSCGARPILAEYSPLPGTALWEASVQASSYDITSEPLYHNNSLLPCQGEQLTPDMYRKLKLLTKTS